MDFQAHGWNRPWQLLFVSVVALNWTASPVSARSWNVFTDGSGDAPTVQAGIDSAQVGDTVFVAPGTYHERIIFRGRDIVVRSSAGPGQTILDATGLTGRVVTFSAGESRAAALQGFTITHGLGGIVIMNSQPSIIGNHIIDNQAQDGGGIWGWGYNDAWFPLIQGNTITGNYASNLAGGIGVLYVVPEILDNYVADNEARDGDGGGIYYGSSTNGIIIRGNTVLNNRAGDHGGGIYAGHIGNSGFLAVEISWNLVSGNYAHGSAPVTPNSGGGIWLWETDAWVHHNTIVENAGDGPDNSYGGGIVVDQPGSPVIEQNIIAFSTNGGGIWCGEGATPTIRNNLAWQNSGGDGVRDCPTWWQSNGNIIDDPHFCDMAGGDFRVASNSGVMTHPAGPLGAFATPGCGPVSILPSTWGSLKSRYH
jgi:parallel beta-helix repeat protein